MITVNVGSNEFNFNVEQKAVNKYLNDVSQNDKINPSVNFLLKTVISDQSEELKKIILMEDNTAKGTLVLNITGIIMQEFGLETEVTLKK